MAKSLNTFSTFNVERNYLDLRQCSLHWKIWDENQITWNTPNNIGAENEEEGRDKENDRYSFAEQLVGAWMELQ